MIRNTAPDIYLVIYFIVVFYLMNNGRIVIMMNRDDHDQYWYNYLSIDHTIAGGLITLILGGVHFDHKQTTS